MHQQGSPLLDEVVDRVPVERKAVVDGKLQVSVETVERRRMVQRTRKIRRQNVFTGEVESVDVGATDADSAPDRAVQVQLRMGEESLTRALCPSCYATVSPLAEALWKVLEGMRSY